MVTQQELKRRQRQIGQPRKPTTVTRRTVTTQESKKPVTTKSKAQIETEAKQLVSKLPLRSDPGKVGTKIKDIAVLEKAVMIAKEREAANIGKPEAIGFRTIQQALARQIGTIKKAKLAGVTPGEIRARETKSEAKARARLATPKEQIVTTEMTTPVRARPVEVIDLNVLAAETKTAGELFAKIKEAKAPIKVTRRPIEVTVQKPILASFEDPEVLARRAEIARRAEESKVVSPVPEEPRLFSALKEDIKEKVQEFIAKPRVLQAKEATLITLPGEAPKRVLTATFPRVKQQTQGVDVALEESIIERRGGFSREGLAAQAKSFKTGVQVTTRQIIGDPVERGLFIASAVLPTKTARKVGQEVIESVPATFRRKDVVKTATDTTTALFISGFAATQVEQGTFGAAAGQIAPFVAPSLVRPTTTLLRSGAKTVGEFATPVLTDKAGKARFGTRKRGTKGRKPKSLVQRGKESRGLVSSVDTTREARLRKAAVAQVQQKREQPVIVLREVGGQIVPKRLSKRELRRFRQTQARSGVGRPVTLQASESIVVSRTQGLSKRAARREKQRLKRSGETSVLLSVQKPVKVLEPTTVTKQTERKSINLDTFLGFEKGRGRKITDGPFEELGQVLKGKKKKALFVEEETVVRPDKGFRPGRKQILMEELRVKREVIGREREIATETAFREITPSAIITPVATSIQKATVSFPTVKTKSFVQPVNTSGTIIDTRLDPLNIFISAQTPSQAVKPLAAQKPIFGSDTVIDSMISLEQIFDSSRVVGSQLFRPTTIVRPPSPPPPVRPSSPKPPGKPFIPKRPIPGQPPFVPGKPGRPFVPKPPRGVKKSKVTPRGFLGLSEEEFAVFLKERGKFREIGRGTRAEAAYIGSEAALSSLAATFQLRKTGQQVAKRSGVGLKPVRRELFREFKVRKGEKIATPGTFIQKRGKRLTTRKEISAIQRARKQKSSVRSQKNNVFGQNRLRGTVL